MIEVLRMLTLVDLNFVVHYSNDFLSSFQFDQCSASVHPIGTEMPEEIKDFVPLRTPSEAQKQRPSSSPVFNQEENAGSEDALSLVTPLKTPKQFLPNYIPFQKATVSSRPHTSANVNKFSKSRAGSNHEFQNNSTKDTKESSLILKTPKLRGNWNTIGIIRYWTIN